MLQVQVLQKYNDNHDFDIHIAYFPFFDGDVPRRPSYDATEYFLMLHVFEINS